jgi:hypothetical protein
MGMPYSTKMVVVFMPTANKGRCLLGIETSFQLDEFLKAHDVWIEYTREDAERERRGLERLGF